MLIFLPDENYAHCHSLLRSAATQQLNQGEHATLIHYRIPIPCSSQADPSTIAERILTVYDVITQRLRSGIPTQRHPTLLVPVQTTHFARLDAPVDDLWMLRVTTVACGITPDILPWVVETLREQLKGYYLSPVDLGQDMVALTPWGRNGAELNGLYRHVGVDATLVPEWQHVRSCLVRQPFKLSETHREDVKFTIQSASLLHGDVTAIYLTLEAPAGWGPDKPSLSDFIHRELPRQMHTVNVFSRCGALPNGKQGVHAIVVVPYQPDSQLGAGRGHGVGLLDRIKQYYAVWASPTASPDCYPLITYPANSVLHLSRGQDGTVTISKDWWAVCHDILVDNLPTLYITRELVPNAYGCPLDEGLDNDGFTIMRHHVNPPPVPYDTDTVDIAGLLRNEAEMPVMVFDLHVDNVPETLPTVLTYVQALRHHYTGTIAHLYHVPFTDTVRILLLLPSWAPVLNGRQDGYGTGVADDVIRLWGQARDPHYPAHHYPEVDIVVIHDRAGHCHPEDDTHPCTLLAQHQRIAETRCTRIVQNALSW